MTKEEIKQKMKFWSEPIADEVWSDIQTYIDQETESLREQIEALTTHLKTIIQLKDAAFNTEDLYPVLQAINRASEYLEFLPQPPK